MTELTSQPKHDRRSTSSRAARAFVQHVRHLDIHQLGAAIHAWHQRVSGADRAMWFAAEEAAADAVHMHNLHTPQERFLKELADLFTLDRPWFTAERPGAAIDASEASAQYVVTLTTIALLASSYLPAKDVDILYSPFEPFIPRDVLLREPC